MHNMTFGL